MLFHNRDFLFTSESVAAGHPDKICDQISDAILDLYLSVDPYSRVAVETMVAQERVIIAGEVRGPDSITNAKIEDIVRHTIRNIGYEQKKFHWQKLKVDIMLNAQSPDIAIGVDGGEGREEGAGDQGIMFGYACNETENLMPAPLYYAHRILQNIADAINASEISGLGPDAKSQVTLLYENGKPIKANSIVVSVQHKEHLTQSQVRELIRPYIIKAFPNSSWMCNEEEFYVNPTGLFIIGGPESDTGLTGRKIIVDTYGGAAPHGGGAFSGKDPSKVDRSAAYAARYLAKNVVAAGLAERCTIQLSYAIGVAKPLSVYVSTHNTGRLSDDRLTDLVKNSMDLTPKGIRNHLNLNKPIYLRTACYGHFGRAPEKDGGFSWEKIDLISKLKGSSW
ncbi:MAG: methionine adenosyltransferase [Alphaproteobacteria bacterium]